MTIFMSISSRMTQLISFFPLGRLACTILFLHPNHQHLSYPFLSSIVSIFRFFIQTCLIYAYIFTVRFECSIVSSLAVGRSLNWAHQQIVSKIHITNTPTLPRTICLLSLCLSRIILYSIITPDPTTLLPHLLPCESNSLRKYRKLELASRGFAIH